MHKAKVLVLDIETAPVKAYVWSLWKQNVALNQIDRDWYILTWAAKWLGEDDVICDSLHHYEVEGENDFPVVFSLHSLLEEADIVIAHNAERFDIPKMNARFLKYEMNPPSPFQIIDTLKVAKKSFRLTSNKLDYLGEFLEVGKKIDTGGFSLWSRCMDGEPAAFEEMLDYNIQDVLLLEEVYKKLLPWVRPHPNLPLYDDDEEVRCPSCGGTHLHKRGTYYTQVGTYQRYKCQDCGSWARERTQKQTASKRKTVLTCTR